MVQAEFDIPDMEAPRNGCQAAPIASRLHRHALAAIPVAS